MKWKLSKRNYLLLVGCASFVSNLWREKEDLTEVLSRFASCYFRECYSLEVKGNQSGIRRKIIVEPISSCSLGWLPFLVDRDKSLVLARISESREISNS